MHFKNHFPASLIVVFISLQKGCGFVSYLPLEDIFLGSFINYKLILFEADKVLNLTVCSYYHLLA